MDGSTRIGMIEGQRNREKEILARIKKVPVVVGTKEYPSHRMLFSHRDERRLAPSCTQGSDRAGEDVS
jgi:hypothetical protein